MPLTAADETKKHRLKLKENKEIQNKVKEKDRANKRI